MNLKIAFSLALIISVSLFSVKPINKYGTLNLENKNDMMVNGKKQDASPITAKSIIKGNTLVIKSAVFNHEVDNGPSLISTTDIFEYESQIKIINVLSKYE